MSPVVIRPDIVVEIISHQGTLGLLALYYADLDRLGIHGAAAVREHICKLLGSAFDLPRTELTKLDTALAQVGARAALQMQVGVTSANAAPHAGEPQPAGERGADGDLQLRLRRAQEARDTAGRDLQRTQQELASALVERDAARAEVTNLLARFAADTARRSIAEQDHAELVQEVRHLTVESERQQQIITEYREKLAEYEELLAAHDATGNRAGRAADEASTPEWGPVDDDF